MRRGIAHAAFFAALPLLVSALFVTTAHSAAIEGLWLTEDRDGVVQIETCGAALCGRIVGIGTFRPDGTPPKDVQGRSQCGIEIMHRLLERAPGRWYGTVTDPEDGRSYDLRLSLDEAGRLEMRGYLGITLFGSTQIWTRYVGTIGAGCRMTKERR